VLERLGLPPDVFDRSADEQRREVERREGLYRSGQDGLELRGCSVILTDDGLATGATMKAAVEAVRKAEPRRLIVAVPVAARVTADEFRGMLRGPGEEFICLYEAEALDGVGRWYDDFRQIQDVEVGELLDAAAC